MSKTLVIAEKPSVAQDIVRALGAQGTKFEKKDDYFENDNYLITSAVGHLLEIAAPEAYDVKRGKWSFAHLPVIPPHFDLRPIDKTKGKLSTIVKLIKRKDVGTLINACDAGREGELIFRLIEQYSQSKLPVSRLWLQSMTPQAIRDGFATLRSDAQMQPLANAARCRSEADWLVGINGTRAMTAFNSRDGGFFLTTVGRVQTPTLSLVVEREEKIRQFVSRAYWEVFADFDVQAGRYSGKWINTKFQKNEDSEQKADRLWSLQAALDVVQAAQNKTARVSEESRASTQASPLLFDLTSLQREANGRFGFSAKTTLSIAQSLYERHKALTYPRTDSRALPEDYLKVAQQTLQMLASSKQTQLAPFAQQALQGGFVRPNKRIFNNAKVSDHFAIIPTLQAPSGLSEAEQKIYDLVAKRFLAVFFTSAEYNITTRLSEVTATSGALQGQVLTFKSEGKVLVKAGWLAIYGKEGQDAWGDSRDAKEGEAVASLVPIQDKELALVANCKEKALQTKPPARYNEATLLSAMESAGKTVEDEELREAMQEKGLGTPATRSSIIEGLITEKYMLREGRDLVATAKAFQLMTLLRGLEVQELCKAELTGEWEYKLSQMEQGKISRDHFMAEIASMTERMVKKAKEYDRDTIPGDYATLTTPCPTCAGVVKENYRRYACTGRDGRSEGCGFSFGKTPAGRTFELQEVEQFLRDKHIGPLEGFRSKAGWPFTAEILLKFDDEIKNYKLSFDFDEVDAAASGEAVSFESQESLGKCPKCAGQVYELGKNYVCANSVNTGKGTTSCDFKTGQVILQQTVSREQMQKLLETGRTDLLDKFISSRTRRPFKAYLVFDAAGGKVNFEFEASKSGSKGRFSRKSATSTALKTNRKAVSKSSDKTIAKALKTAKATDKKPKKVTKTLKPSAELAKIIGEEATARTTATKQLWDYIKAHNLQDSQNKRNINADALLRPVFDKDQVSMFELAGILNRHLS